MYPQGDYSEFMDNDNYNYDLSTGWKYYYRQFTNNKEIQPELNKKQSGTFIIDGITKEEFFDSNFEFKICVLKEETSVNGTKLIPHWFDVKKPRRGIFNEEDKTYYDGILADLEVDSENRLHISWAFNGDEFTFGNNGDKIINDGVLLKIGMNENFKNMIIKRIELVNFITETAW